MQSIAHRWKSIFHLIATSLIALSLVACNGNDDSSNENTNDEQNTLTAPATPTGFQATPGFGQIQLQWNTVTNAESYTIYWSDAPSVDITTASNIDIIGGSVASEGLDWTVNGTTYYFVMVARNGAGASAPTTEISATPGEFLDSITLLNADPLSYRVSLNWPAVNGATSYDIYRSTTPNVTDADTWFNSTTNSFTNDALTNGTTYYYRVRARTSTDASPLSNEISATPGVRWQKVSYNPDLSGVAYGNGVYVAVGTNGGLFKSTDGTSWTMQDSGVEHDLNDVTYANSTFVIVGDAGTVLTSADAITWTRVYNITLDNLLGIDYVNNVFLAVGDGVAIYSSDGSSWTVTDPGNNTPLLGSAYGAGVYVLVGPAGAIFTSADLSSWSNVSTGSAYLEDIAYLSNKFVAVNSGGDAIESTNGSVWSSIVGLSGYNAIISQNNKWIAVGLTGKSVYSNDGINWFDISLTAEYNLLDIALGPDKYVTVGMLGKSAYSNDISTMSSWTDATPGYALSLNGISYNYATGSELFVITGDSGTLITSTDGSSWSAATSGTTQNLNASTWGWNGTIYRHVVVGDSETIRYSDDRGATWNAATTPGNSTSLVDVAYNDNVYVATGSNGVILKSSDGITWSNATIVTAGYGGASFSAVDRAPNSGVFVTVTGSGNILVSDATGDNWAEATHDVFANISAIAYDNSGTTHKFVVAGDNKVMASTDATASSWDASSSFVNGIAVRSIEPYDSGLIAIGIGGMTANGNVGSWTEYPSGLTSNLNDVVHTNVNSGLFVIVGENGLIATHGNDF